MMAHILLDWEAI